MCKREVNTNYLAVDLEMNQPSGKIIQIGAVAGSSKEGEEVSYFSVIINPREELATYIVDLTGITQVEVDGGVSFLEGYKKLVEFAKVNDVFINPVTWGGGDICVIREELEKSDPEIFLDIPWEFGRRWIDTKTLYCAYRIANGKPPSGGLAKAMTKFGMAFKGRKHDAKDDAYNTLRMFRKLISYYGEKTTNKD